MKKIFLLIIISILLVGIVSAVGVEYCCEKTTEGAWCLNVEDESRCITPKDPPATSCESTSYCKLGCCINSKEGGCKRNTPKKTCEENGGTWKEGAKCDISQCQKGCCILGDIGEWTTQAECNWKGSLLGTGGNFRKDIQSEIDCVLTVIPNVNGACVFEKDPDITTCEFTTREKCDKIENAKFYRERLCTDESLGTNCVRTDRTTCIKGKEEVYFIDTCGNIANIFDSSKKDDNDYWSRIYTKEESCGYNEKNAGSKKCGNCDPFLGSTCSENKICRDMSCKYKSKTYQHGDSWCAWEDDGNKGAEENLPGGEHFVLECRDGEVLQTMCDSGRQQICIESDVGEVPNAACKKNLWEDCWEQDNEEDCENREKGYCKWMGDDMCPNSKKNCKWTKDLNVKCVPEYPAGIKFWEPSQTDIEYCSLASFQCVVKYDRSFWEKGWNCIENCECTETRWKKNMNILCTSLGDCGSSRNYLGYKGWNKE